MSVKPRITPQKGAEVETLPEDPSVPFSPVLSVESFPGRDPIQLALKEGRVSLLRELDERDSTSACLGKGEDVP